MMLFTWFSVLPGSLGCRLGIGAGSSLEHENINAAKATQKDVRKIFIFISYIIVFRFELT
jgi:hypothetical protein